MPEHQQQCRFACAGAMPPSPAPDGPGPSAARAASPAAAPQQEDTLARLPRGTKGVKHRQWWEWRRPQYFWNQGSCSAAPAMVGGGLGAMVVGQMMEIMQSMQELLWVMVVVLMFCSLGAVDAGLKGSCVRGARWDGEQKGPGANKVGRGREGDLGGSS